MGVFTKVSKTLKKLLILAYDFPPYISVGALRPAAWYKYLYEFGVYPIVVTRQWASHYGNHLDYIAEGNSDHTIIEESSTGTIIRTPYKPNLANRIMLKYGEKRFRMIRKIISAYYELVQWFFWTGPKVQLYFAANEYLKANKVDTIIATGDPFILFRYASVLSKKYGIPWIADYRDPWVQKGYNFVERLLSRYHAYLERKYIRESVVITTVSEFFKHIILENVGDAKSFIIANGYDEDSISNIADIKQSSERLTLSFAGTIYKWHPIEIFLDVLHRFISNGNDIIVKFYGINIESELRTLIGKKYPDIDDNIKIIKKLPNQTLLSELSKDNTLLLFKDYSIVGTKIFDYVALKRKIVFCFTDDEQAKNLKKLYFRVEESGKFAGNPQQDIIIETRSGVLVKDSQHLYQVLEELYLEYKTYGYIRCDSVGTEKFSRKVQTKYLSEVIKKVVENEGPNYHHRLRNG